MTSKMVFTGNILPQITSTEDKVAFHRRNIIIPFNQKFVGRNCDKNKLEKITTPEELSGLLNYALEGLKRLMENKSFSIEENPEEMRNEYIKHSNSALAFTETQLKASLNPEDELDKREVFKDYKTYCKKNKLKAVTERTLNSTIKDAFQDVEDFVTSKDGKSVRKWRYLKKNYETSKTTDITPHVKNQLLDYGVGNETCSLNSSVVSEDSEKDIKENLDVL